MFCQAADDLRSEYNLDSYLDKNELLIALSITKIRKLLLLVISCQRRYT